MAYIRKRGKSYEYTVSKTINGQTQRVSKGGFFVQRNKHLSQPLNLKHY
jgi:hypothetical protein